jgi:ABC-type Fe3+-hydroxamate transport system substrate-binding protein
MPGFTDQIGRTIELKAPPRRIVSLVPSITETICDLGLQEAVVGATNFCVHPVGLKCARVGGTKNFKLAQIEALQPDLIVANKEENPKIPIEKLAEKYPVWVSEVKDTASALDMIARLGSLLSTETRAQGLVATLKSGLSSLTSIGDAAPKEQATTALYLIWRKPYMAAGTDSFISHLMAAVGLSNALEAWKEKGLRYPRIAKEDITKLQPDFILLSTEPYPFKQFDADEMKIHARRTALLVDGEAFSWYGSRMLHCMPYLHEFRRQTASFRD